MRTAILLNVSEETRGKLQEIAEYNAKLGVHMSLDEVLLFCVLRVHRDLRVRMTGIEECELVIEKYRK